MRKLLSKAEVIEIVGLSYPCIWSLMRRNQFPRSIQATPGGATPRWYADEVAQWLETRPRTRLKGDPEPEGDDASAA